MRLITLAAVALTPCASAQMLSIVAQEGDSVPGVGALTRIDGLDVAADGSWLVEADTDNADTDTDQVMLNSSGLLFRENDSIANPVGALLDNFDGTSLLPGGATAFNLFLDGTTGTNDDSGIYVNGGLIVQESGLSTAAGFSPGTTYRGFFDVKFTGSDLDVLAVASMDDPLITSTVDRALMHYDIDGTGTLLGETVIAKEGDILPGQTEAIADFETGAEEYDMNAAGQVIYTVDLAGPTATDRAIYLDTVLLMQEGSPSPIAGRNWGSLTSVEVDLNSAGDWVAKANLDNTDTATDDVIVLNGAIYRRAGETLAAISGFSFTDFGGGVGVWVTEAGDVIWFGDWDDPDTSRDEGLFFNDQLIVQEGVTQVGGQLIVDLTDFTEQVAVSPDGNFILLEGEINNGNTDLDVAVLIEMGFGSNYCTALPNSTGVPGGLSATGSSSIADNDVTLVATNLPPGQFGIFLTSLTQDQVMLGEGNLCLGGEIGRYQGPGQILTATGGTFSLAIDLTAMPQGNMGVPVMTGQTWNFQAWHRDFDMGGGNTSNLTVGLAIAFN